MSPASEPREDQLTCNAELYQEADADYHEQHVQYEVFVVIDRNTIINPRAMAAAGQLGPNLSWEEYDLTGLLSPHIYRTVGNVCCAMVFVSYMLYKNVFR